MTIYDFSKKEIFDKLAAELEKRSQRLAEPAGNGQ